MEQVQPNQKQYFVWVDILRGLSAASVLIWHYHLFYSNFVPVGQLDRSIQPFYDYLSPFYLFGEAAVQMFWAISGFVFAGNYLSSKDAISGKEFFVNRFARLYPLHLVTLLIMASLQMVSFATVGHYQIFTYNDLYHFVAHLLFVSSWGVERGTAYNYPIWSVSIEIPVYVVFCAIAFYVRIRDRLIYLAFFGFAFAYLLHFPGPIVFWKCGMYFFSGCISFHFWNNWPIRAPVKFIAAVLAIAAAIGVKATVSNPKIGQELLYLLAFPAVIIIAAFADVIDKNKIGLKFRVIGDITYSTYLWHVPVVVVCLIVIERMALGPNLVSSKIFFIAFFAVVFWIGVFSFKFLETPLRLAIRNMKPIKRRAIPAAPGG
jgi:peptidoglycan/LPS O-acetylase OafA/YrhL